MSVDGERRSEILDAAAILFASSGLRTSLKEIADACGIKPGSLYHHFESKDAIIVELVERYTRDIESVAADAKSALDTTDPESIERRIVEFGRRIATTSTHHRAALLFTLYDPPSGASDELVRSVSASPDAVHEAMGHTLRAGRNAGLIRDGIDLDILANRICQVLLHVGLGVFADVRGADAVPEIRCRAILDGIATEGRDDQTLNGSEAFAAAERTIASWEQAEDTEDGVPPILRSVARAEFGRKGYESTTVRDIAGAAGMSTASVYRLVGSKDELLASIMQSFVERARSGWRAVVRSSSNTVEKLDALTWLNINVIDRFSDEYNIQLAWLRESPPTSADLGTSFAARLKDVKTLLGRGIRSGELRIEAPTADIRAWSIFELLWMPEDIVSEIGTRAALELARETTLRGAAARS